MGVWRQFEDDAPSSALGAAVAGCSVEIACFVEDDFVPGARPVPYERVKAMGHGYGQLLGRGLTGRQFKDGAEIVSAAIYGSAVEVTCLIDAQGRGNG